MNHILKNTLLVFVLTGLLTLPTVGFGFVGYEPSQETVLGVQDVRVATPNDDLSAESLKKDYEVVDQIDLKLALSGDSYQKFYDVIPENLVDSAYTYIIVVPKEIKELGFTAKIEQNKLKADLVVNVEESFPTQSVPVTILVLR